MARRRGGRDEGSERFRKRHARERLPRGAPGALATGEAGTSGAFAHVSPQRLELPAGEQPIGVARDGALRFVAGQCLGEARADPHAPELREKRRHPR
jgi:hypothetical protein